MTKFRDMNEFQREKFQDAMNDHCLDGVSSCCSAPTSSDLLICSDCGEHCDVVEEEEDEETSLTQDEKDKGIMDRLCKQLKQHILDEAKLKKEINWYRNYSAYINKIHPNCCGEASDYADKCDTNE